MFCWVALTFLFTVDYGETRKLLSLCATTKRHIAKLLPLMSHILVQNLNSVSARRLQLLGMRCRGITSVKLSFLHALVGGTMIAYVLPRAMVKQGNCWPRWQHKDKYPWSIISWVKACIHFLLSGATFLICDSQKPYWFSYSSARIFCVPPQLHVSSTGLWYNKSYVETRGQHQVK